MSNETELPLCPVALGYEGGLRVNQSTAPKRSFVVHFEFSDEWTEQRAFEWIRERTEQAKDTVSEPRYSYEEAQRAVVRDLILTALWKAPPDRSEEGFAIVDGMIARLAEKVQGFQDAVNADLERREEERAVERTWAP